jgi:predicted acyltransferase
MTEKIIEPHEKKRVLSVDFLRGFTMFLLVSGFSSLFDPKSTEPIIAMLGRQLDHAPWAGLTPWDLIQPVFMFIAGVSMPLSIVPKWKQGVSWKTTFYAALKRSIILLLLGWIIQSEIQSSFANVLSQLGVTYFIAFLLMRLEIKWQLVVSFALILLTDIIYRTFSVPGFDQPFTPDHNFGTWLDLFYTGAFNEDHWVSFNAVPTAAHTIWGVVCGLILMKDWKPKRKVNVLLVAGAIGIIVGYILSLYVPIIKRICTSSFVITSGGYAVLFLGICFYVIDVLQIKKWVFPFAIVGMNPLFIYLFWHSGGSHVMETLASPVITRLFGWAGPKTVEVVMVLTIAMMLWYICYFMYRRKIFIRI